MKLTSAKGTMLACYTGYITQAIANNFAPLLFLRFLSDYHLQLAEVTLITTLNFAVQLLVDLFSAKYAERIGYRTFVILAHVFCTLGIGGLAILPNILPSYAGLLLCVILYAIGGGIIEVLISPIVESCPSDNKEAAMALLHSFYCWGHVGVVLLSVLYFKTIGMNHWQGLALLWALVPLAEPVFPRDVQSSLCDDDCGGSERTGDEPVDERICGIRASCLQDGRGSCRTVRLCLHDGMRQGIVCRKERKGVARQSNDVLRASLHRLLFPRRLFRTSDSRLAGMRTVRVFGRDLLAGNLFHGCCQSALWRHRHVCTACIGRGCGLFPGTVGHRVHRFFCRGKPEGGTCGFGNLPCDHACRDCGAEKTAELSSAASITILKPETGLAELIIAPAAGFSAGGEDHRAGLILV